MPIFDFDDATEIATVWFLAWKDTDWMAITYRQGPAAPWQCTYRFRYYATTGPARTDAWATGDRKSARTATARLDDPEGLAKLTRACDTMRAEMACAETLYTNDRLQINGNTDAYVRVLAGRPWAHIKVSPPAPAQPQ